MAERKKATRPNSLNLRRDASFEVELNVSSSVVVVNEFRGNIMKKSNKTMAVRYRPGLFRCK